MRGLDWAALDIVAEMIGISDVELFIAQLMTIRNWQHDNPTED